MHAIELFSPAKLNLFLAITGRRADGFHDLVSVVVTLDFGDTLRAERREDGQFMLACDQPEVPVDETNLVVRAARAWREAAGEDVLGGGVSFVLEKRIPMGAGLGGGSSNAVAALRALTALGERSLGEAQLGEIAARLGSDCPLFLDGEPLVMRGRGERIEKLPAAAAARLRGRRVLVFKPSFGINTGWAYQQMVAADRCSRELRVESPEPEQTLSRMPLQPTALNPYTAPSASSEDRALDSRLWTLDCVSPSYLASSEAEAKLAAWIADQGARAEALLFNNMEAAAFRKFLALPTLLAQLRADFGLAVGMSGSGSACFALLEEITPVVEVVARIRAAWGEDVFVTEAKIR